jgi:hypothetical protein
MAEVTVKDSFGAAMYKTVSKYKIYSVLEIGAFNGDGSTQVIVKALQRKRGKIALTSLEYDPERYLELVSNTRDFSFVRTVNQSSIGKGSFTAWDFESDVWGSPHNGLKSQYPEEEVKKWHQNDVRLMQQISDGYLEKRSESWDAVLIDGGEFCGWDEYRLLKDRVKCIMIDDAYKAYKTFRCRVELLNDPEWVMSWSNPYVRNGAAIFVRKTLLREPLVERLKMMFTLK